MIKKSKIVLIANTSNFFNAFLLNHVQELNKKYSLFICCNDADKLKKFIPKNVSLININFKRGFNLPNDIITFVITLFFFLKIKPNLSISFTPKIGFIVALVSFILRTPNRIHWFTGQIWVNKKGFSKTFYRIIDKLIHFLSHNVLIDSISQRNFLINEKVISSKKSYVLHNGSVGGVNIKKFSFNKKKKIELRQNLSISKQTFVFLYLGRINKDKGVIELLKAFKKINKKHDVLLIFVGSIEEKQFFNEFKNDKKILYYDFTNKPENWFTISDILCLPSYREGFGTVVIEAASCGIPALCSNIYGLNDSIINYKTGIFHKVGSINDIKKKMLYILNNKKLIKKYGSLARKRAQKDFEQSLITKKFLKFLKSKTT